LPWLFSERGGEIVRHHWEDFFHDLRFRDPRVQLLSPRRTIKNRVHRAGLDELPAVGEFFNG